MLVYVSNQRRLPAERVAKGAADQRDRMARVQVSDEVWAAFRAGLGTTPVNVALGHLVRRAVGRRPSPVGIEQPFGLAVQDARTVVDELRALVARADPDRLALEHVAARDDEPSADAR
jgi:hypothetical protein